MDALIVIGLLIFTAILYKRLYWGLYLILFLLPTYLIRFKIGPIPFTFLEGMILILAAIWFFKKLQHKELLKNLKSSILNFQSTKWPIFLLIIAATISIFVSSNRLSALGDWRAFFIEPLILFVIFLDLVRGEKEIKNVFYALGASAIYVSLFIFYQIFTGYLVPLNYLKEGRMTSFYGYPAAVGLFIAPILALFIGSIIKNLKSKISNLKSKYLLFSIIVVIFSSLALLATKTEGAYLGVLAATFIILMFTSWRKWVLIGSAVILIITMAIPVSRSYIIQKATFSDVSGNVRLVLWQGTFRALKANPIFGGGLSGFPTLYQKYKENRHVELLKYPHNVIFNFWSETGILGLFAFLWLIFEFFRKVFLSNKLQATSPDRVEDPCPDLSGRDYKLAIIAAMLSLLIYGLLDVPYFKNDLSILFWILIGLSIL